MPSERRGENAGSGAKKVLRGFLHLGTGRGGETRRKSRPEGNSGGRKTGKGMKKIRPYFL